MRRLRIALEILAQMWPLVPMLAIWWLIVCLLAGANLL